MKNRYLFLILIILSMIVAAYFVFAEFTGSSLDSPADDSWDSDGTVEFNCTFTSGGVNVTTNISLYTNFTGSWEINTTNSTPITSGTPYNFTLAGIAEGVWIWNCLASDNVSTTRWGDTTANYTIKVDTTNPVIKLDSPANASTDSDGSVSFTYTPTDTNLDACILWHNASGWAANVTNSSPTSGSENSVTLTLNEGTYIWNVWCNDSAGNSAFNATNYTVSVDISEPTGGGIGSNIEPTIYIYKIPLEITPRTVALKGGDSIEFTFKNVQYIIKVTDIGKDSATITVSSVVPTTTLNVGESKEIDLDRDGTNDLYMKLDKISGNKLYLTIKHISVTASVTKVPVLQYADTAEINTPPELVQTQPPQPSQQQPEPPKEQPKQPAAVQEPKQPQQQKEGGSSIVSALIIVAINIIGLTVFFIATKKKKKK